MKKLLLIACALCTTAFAAPKWANIALDPELKGWHVISGDWKVVDGVLTGKATEGQAIIVLDQPLADFDAELEFHTPQPCAVAAYGRGHVAPVLPLAKGADPAAAPKRGYGYGIGADTKDLGASAHFAIETFPTAPTNAAATRMLPVARDWNHAAIRAHGTAVSGALNHGAVWKLTDDTFLGGNLVLTVGAIDATSPSEAQFRAIRVKDFGREGKWRPLWDEISLNAFEFYGEEEWRVLDGGIVGTSGKKKSEGYAKTRETFKDFRVRGKFRMFGDGNYGLFYHSTIAYDDKHYPIISGVQGEVAWGYPSPSGCLYESYKRGWLKEPDMNTLGAFAQNMTEINEIEIMAEGNRRETWVNGVKVTDLVDDKPNYTEGAFALQLHTGGVSGIMWRDLYVLEK